MAKDNDRKGRSSSESIAMGGVRVLRKEDDGFSEAVRHFFRAAEVAKESPCAIDKRGAVVVAGSERIGEGYNGPDKEWGKWVNTTCTKDYCPYDKKDGPCPGLHAELRAILGVPKQNLKDATVYHVKIKKEKTDEECRMVASRSICPHKGREGKACSDCAPKLREVGIREIGIVVNVSEDGTDIEEIHMCPMDAYYSTAFPGFLE